MKRYSPTICVLLTVCALIVIVVILDRLDVPTVKVSEEPKIVPESCDFLSSMVKKCWNEGGNLYVSDMRREISCTKDFPIFPKNY